MMCQPREMAIWLRAGSSPAGASVARLRIRAVEDATQPRLRGGPRSDVPPTEQRAVLLGEEPQREGYVDRRAVRDPRVLAREQPRHESRGQLVGGALVDQVAEQVRTPLA